MFYTLNGQKKNGATTTTTNEQIPVFSLRVRPVLKKRGHFVLVPGFNRYTYRGEGRRPCLHRLVYLRPVLCVHADQHASLAHPYAGGGGVDDVVDDAPPVLRTARV